MPQLFEPWNLGYRHWRGRKGPLQEPGPAPGVDPELGLPSWECIRSFGVHHCVYIAVYYKCP